MKQEIEIEFKNLLTKEEFERVKHAFGIDDRQFIYQENHYFDTPHFLLKEKGAALRIRAKQNTYTLTLKQTIEQGLLETHETITQEKAQSILNNPAAIQGEIKKILQSMGIAPNQLHHFGTLATNRAQIAYKGGLLVLDHSHYLQTDDYELEYEASHFAKGKEAFEELLASLNIPTRPTANKIKRLYTKKYGVEDKQ
ncbi:CYTH domain-containing protein [Anoxybacteroides tepidamans]|uniref:CYTH domain-containing protein n=1 Tax=Anoxybacteroides tepidamans TaxID=265948 RepID=UPI000485AA73|nr:CYTH domain-containing protein [Anoxybacillus tepidamans]